MNDDFKLTPSLRSMLQWIADANGCLMMIQVTGNGTREYNKARDLRNAGLVRFVDHPTVKDATRTYPVDAIFITDAGRAALAQKGSRKP